MIKLTTKDPDEVLDYSWQPALDTDDTIQSYTVTLISGTVVIGTVSATTSLVTFWISGGAHGESAELQARVVTVAGRTFEETLLLPIVSTTTAFLSSFAAAFPAFAGVAPDAILYWYEQATETIDSRFGARQAHATMLMTAHLMTMQGYGAGSESQRLSKFGGATEVKSGTLSLKWDASPTGYQSTSYGRQLWPYIQAFLGGPRVTSTGTVPCLY